MSNVPSDLKYAKSHEWVRVDGDSATVGITDHAQHELTDVVFVELPDVGKKVKAGEACAVVESVRHWCAMLFGARKEKGHAVSCCGRSQ